jgi:hypothetical protein
MFPQESEVVLNSVLSANALALDDGKYRTSYALFEQDVTIKVKPFRPYFSGVVKPSGRKLLSSLRNPQTQAEVPIIGLGSYRRVKEQVICR